jgi:hypothetical protein
VLCLLSCLLLSFTRRPCITTTSFSGIYAQTILVSSLLALNALAYSSFLQDRTQTLNIVAAAPAAIHAAPIVDASGSLVKRQAGTAKPDKVESKIDEVISNKLSELDIDAFKDASGSPDNRKGKRAGPASPSPAPPNPPLEVAEVPEKLENADSPFCLFCDLF